MKDAFNAAAAALTEAEEFLHARGIAHEKRPDGSIFVPKDVDLSEEGLTELPDLSPVIVGGSFYCHKNKLKSLKGAPRSVGGDFYCNDNLLTSLAHAPQCFSGIFHCADNLLASLEGAPVGSKEINSDFGEFSWAVVPPDLRVSPETRARQQREAVEAATVLQAPLKLQGALRLKK